MIDAQWFKELKAGFFKLIPDVDFASLRYHADRSQYLCVRQDVPEPVRTGVDQGIMITIVEGNGAGYAATGNLTEDGIRQAIDEARCFAALTGKYPLMDYAGMAMPSDTGEYRFSVEKSWDSMTLGDKIGLLRSVSESLRISDAVVDWEASLRGSETNTAFITSTGGEIVQRFSHVIPDICVIANRGAETVKRTLGRMSAYCRQGGLEILDAVEFTGAGRQIAEQALELLDAPNCPEGCMDLLLDATQMLLQIHESIGHPLEVDRIMGDERNYAGTSFVTPEMFGTYRYGSDLLNITFDPTIGGECASYAFDDDGTPAEKRFLIEKGILKRGLGGRLSQHRSGIPGVACSRAGGWNRPPIDRMANLNLEPGTSTFDEMVAAVEKGIYMDVNTSWSIDDSRNKFQFGCEWAQLIESGKLTRVVKKPNYRGISESFWRSLKMVGSRDTVKVLGTPNCGKGEPNQIIHTGHASPTALFSDVDVFGGE